MWGWPHHRFVLYSAWFDMIFMPNHIRYKVLGGMWVPHHLSLMYPEQSHKCWECHSRYEKKTLRCSEKDTWSTVEAIICFKCWECFSILYSYYWSSLLLTEINIQLLCESCRNLISDAAFWYQLHCLFSELYFISYILAVKNVVLITFWGPRHLALWAKTLHLLYVLIPSHFAMTLIAEKIVWQKNEQYS